MIHSIAEHKVSEKNRKIREPEKQKAERLKEEMIKE